MAIDFNGKVLGFYSLCVGIKTDVSFDAEVIIGFWKGIDRIKTTSMAFNAGIDAPGTEIGASAGIVLDSDNMLIGGTFATGVGVGISPGPIPIEVSADKCKTSVL